MKVIPVAITVALKDVTANSFKIWLQTRLGEAPLAGAYEFPGGKLEPNESPKACAAREWNEEVGIELSVNDLIKFKTYRYDYEQCSVSLNVFLTRTALNLPSSGWVEIKDGHMSEEVKEKILAANHVIVSELSENIKTHVVNESWESVWPR